MNGEIVYRHLLCINTYGKVPMTSVKACKHSPIPISLFTEERIMHGGMNSESMYKLEELLPEQLQNRKGDRGWPAVIHDGHVVDCIMQKLA